MWHDHITCCDDGSMGTRRKGTKKGYDLYLPLGHRMILLPGMLTQMSPDLPRQLLRQLHLKNRARSRMIAAMGLEEFRGRIGGLASATWCAGFLRENV